MTKLGRNGKSQRLLLYCFFLSGFLLLWCFLTILIIIAQDKILGPATSISLSSSNDDGNNHHQGIQVIVGHYNGNLPAEHLANLTQEQFNANNYNPISGYGEDGRPVNLAIKDELESEKTFGINQFNLWISDRIALNRTLPDVRRMDCRQKQYPPTRDLPTTSVIIVYHNEAYSTLCRTITSIITRSPAELLQEIILVDDFSTRTFLKTDLEKFVIGLPVRVKIIRAKERVGLIRARLMGAAEAEGDVLTFLDSHCECTKGWLEPLLARIKENRKAVVCPIIDVINDRTFAYQKGIELFRGGFNWNLQFRWYSVPSKIAKIRAADSTAPIESPTMAGGLFSIRKDYFEELGSYDAGMDIWGGENIELSFRVWQCGGRIEILPCSHVGHIFRKASPHDFPKGSSSGKVLNGNLVRVSEVWMDEWKYLFYKISPQASSLSKTIDVSDRIELKKRLFCKDFAWYLKHVWPEHFLPTPGAFFGRLSHVPSNECIISRPSEAGKKHKLMLSQCTLGFDFWQLWVYKNGQLKSDEYQCLSAIQVVHTSNQWIVQLKECGQHQMEYWDYNGYYHTFVHRTSGLCLDEPIEPDSADLTRIPTVRKCRRAHSSQQWKLMPIRWLPERFYDEL